MKDRCLKCDVPIHNAYYCKVCTPCVIMDPAAEQERLDLWDIDVEPMKLEPGEKPITHQQLWELLDED